MNPAAVALIRQSWRALEPAGPALVAAIHARLFRLEPSLREQFGTADLAAESRRLAEALGLVVASLDDPEAMVTLAASLGRSQAHAGLTSRHYDLFGEALLGTLRDALDPAWNLELHDAWAEAYILFASIMKRASARASGEYLPGLPMAR